MADIRFRCNFKGVRDGGNGKVSTEFQFQNINADGTPLNSGFETGNFSMAIVGDKAVPSPEMGDIISLVVEKPTK